MLDEIFFEVETKLSELYDRVSQLESAPTVPSGGGGGGAPANATYLVNSADPTLTNEVVVTAVRGRIIYGNATPEWTTLNHPGFANRLLTTDANDVLWSTNTLQLSSNAILDYNGNTITLNANLTNNGGTAGQVAYWSALNTIAGENQLNLSRGGTGQDFSSIARGDLIVADATPDLSLLNIGAANTILQSDGNDPSWQTLSSAGIAANDESYLVVNLSGDLTSERSININNGLTATDGGANANYTVNLGTPSTLNITSTNAVTAASHTHAVTASSDVSAGTAALLKSTAAGALTLADLYVPDGGFAGVSGGPGWTFDSTNETIIAEGNSFPVMDLRRATSKQSGVASTLRMTTITSVDMVDGFGGRIWFAIRDTAGVDNLIGAVGAFRDGADDSGMLDFASVLNGTPVSRLKIWSDGIISLGATKTHEYIDTISTAGIVKISSRGGTRIIGDNNDNNPATNVLFGVYDVDETSQLLTVQKDGSVGINDTAPAYKLDVGGDANVTGVYRVDDGQVVTNRQTGWGAPTGTATRTAFATSTVTLEDLAERVHALIDDLTTHGLIGA